MLADVCSQIRVQDFVYLGNDDSMGEGEQLLYRETGSCGWMDDTPLSVYSIVLLIRSIPTMSTWVKRGKEGKGRQDKKEV